MSKDQLYKKAPEMPGVYVMRDIKNKVIYVGKAVNLKRRVSSYFMRPHDERIEALVREIKKIVYEVTDSALEALILESKLIKQHEPKYNIREKDDKSFLYVEITKEKFPRITLVRGKEEKTGTRFGPFTYASSIRKGLDIIRKIFPWSDHSSPKDYGIANHSDNKLKPCFNYQIGLCPGTCVGAINREEYVKNIKNIKLFFNGQKKRIIRALEKEMTVEGRALNFEKAVRIRGQIFALQHIHDTALIEEDQIIHSGEERSCRIEGYDISNISGTSAVGGMVVFVNDKPVKSEYRLFKIRAIRGANDTGMMTEMVRRRLKNNWPLPDIMLVDGGLGHINAVRVALSEAGLRIPIIGIAKGSDRKGNRFVGADYSCINKKILIAARDEAHRFSRNFHIKTRAKKLFT